MNFWTLVNRAKGKISRIYRKKVFLSEIGCCHSDVDLVGDITLINRNLTLGHNVTIYPEVMFFGDGTIRICDNVAIGNGTIIYASKLGGVTIGSDSMIAAQCYIIDSDHGTKANDLMRNQKTTVSSVEIGSDVWIAAGCKILKGSCIHDGAIIGASSLVKGEIPSNAIAVGVPARVKKYRE